MKVQNGRTGFSAWDTMKTFLFKTARNACLDWLRDEKRHAAHTVAIGRLAVDGGVVYVRLLEKAQF
jgi:DNA-directed RNA polymerase specialized sigma24 family protein